MGPTAVGKSALALRLAQRYEADIITADSRQVYRYMDIGTAKPSGTERALVPHYMLDVVEPSDTYTAARFRDEAGRVLARTAASGRPALIAGGTGFYVRALLDSLSLPAVPPDPNRRAAYAAEVESLGVQALHRRLEELDPTSAARIHPNNVSRVIRALEIVEETGCPVPAPDAGTAREALYLGLSMERRALHEIADRRVLRQVDAGLVEETRLLLEMGYDPASPALSGFGYREMVAYLSGWCTLAQAIEDYQVATHRYIRRQMTWFRADRRIHWVEGFDPDAEACRTIDEWLARAASAEAPGSDENG